MEDIIDSLTWARKNREAVLVLGKGSNILVSDKGWDGLVIDLSARWTGIAWDGCTAESRSGALLHTLVKESVDRGCAGLEKLAGIPGSVGGAVVMNAGAFGRSVSDCLISVECLDPLSAELKTLGVRDLGASYRSTVFKNSGAIVVSARFCFVKGDPSAEVREAFREVLARRKDRHPLDLPNCGSVFKNPPGTTAGKLIEQCGLKGAQRGAAEVSRKHANFIVNHGNASASDVRGLISYVQKTVYEKSGVLLEPEVIFAGEFSEPLFTPG
jgi:UDP-N-acetylmuramate dehydrogenase